jgi:hypothetical protein
MQQELAALHIDDAQLDELVQDHERDFQGRQMNPDLATKNPEMFHTPIDKIREVGARLKAICPK